VETPEGKDRKCTVNQKKERRRQDDNIAPYFAVEKGQRGALNKNWTP